MLESEGYLERGDGPAKAVLRANAEQQAIRRAMETREELEKIRNRVCVVRKIVLNSHFRSNKIQ